jgi:integrase
MRRGSLETKSRLEGADVWQLRWSEKGPNGRRVYRKRVIGTVEEYPDADSARNAICGLISEVNWTNQRQPLSAMTVAQRHTSDPLRRNSGARWSPPGCLTSNGRRGQ